MYRSLEWGKRLALGACFAALVGCGGGASSAGGSGGGSFGSSSSSSSAPIGRTGTPATGSYTIAWDTVSNPSVTGYRVYFDYTPIGSGRTPTYTDASTATVTLRPGDHGIFAGETMYVAVASRGASGEESPVSSQVSIVVQ